MSVRFRKGSEAFDAEVCWQGLNILGHAQIIELFIGSKCGGHGECGADRIRLAAEDQKKVNAPTSVETKFLSTADLEAGIRIACQCFPNSDDLQLDVFLDNLKVPSSPLA